ncbi:hypothetical protein Tco_0267867 [Tanacetum coccineum]
MDTEEEPLTKLSSKEDKHDIILFKSIDDIIFGLTKKSWPDINLSVCACSRFQVTPKSFHLRAVKRILGGCNILAGELNSCNAKSRLIMATSTTEDIKLLLLHTIGGQVL